MKKNEIESFIRSIPKGRIVGIEFIKRDGTYRKGNVCFGVKNPKYVVKPGHGTKVGLNFEDAIENGVLKFYDIHAENKYGTKGDYRSARIDNIISITYKGKHTIEA